MNSLFSALPETGQARGLQARASAGHASSSPARCLQQGPVEARWPAREGGRSRVPTLRTGGSYPAVSAPGVLEMGTPRAAHGHTPFTAGRAVYTVGCLHWLAESSSEVASSAEDSGGTGSRSLGWEMIHRGITDDWLPSSSFHPSVPAGAFICMFSHGFLRWFFLVFIYLF